MHGISKRGDRYLRTLLIHGARSVMTNDKALPAWVLRLLERRPRNVVVVALARRMARMILGAAGARPDNAGPIMSAGHRCGCTPPEAWLTGTELRINNEKEMTR